MSLRLTDKKVEEIKFDTTCPNGTKKDKTSYDKLLRYVEYNGDDIKKLIPKGQQYRVSCVISNTYPGFANAIRRCLHDDLLIKGLHIDGSHVDTDDKYILKDHPRDELIRNINNIPINQDINWETINMRLNVTNNTDETISVLTGDIKIDPPQVDPFPSTIEICDLRPGKYLEIKRFVVISRSNRVDGAFGAVANISYWPVTDEKKSTLVQEPTKFEFAYTTYRCSTRNPTMYMVMVCDNLIGRINMVHDELDKPDEERTATGKVRIEKRDQLTRFIISGEHWTLTNLLARACYAEDPTMFVSPNIEHPSIDNDVLDMKHQEPIKLLKTVTKQLIKDLNYFKSQW